MKHRWRRFCDWLLRMLGLLRARDHIAAVEAVRKMWQERFDSECRRIREDCVRSIEQASASAKKIVEASVNIEWRGEESGRYGLYLQFDPHIWGRMEYGRADMRFMAEMIGKRVEADIASCKFVQDARAYRERTP